MARQFTSGGYTMILWARSDGARYFARWFCTCEKCCGESVEAYGNEEEALNAAEKHLPHLYTAHARDNGKHELPKPKPDSGLIQHFATPSPSVPMPL